MKRILLILSTIFSLVSIQAQTYLNDGDYVTISFIANDFRFYLEASGDGLRTTNTISDHCLWEMKIVDGKYRLRDLTTGKYLRCDFTDPSNSSLILTNETSADAFSFADKGSKEGVYMQGHFYVSHYYAPWHGTFAIYLDMHWINNSPNFVFHSWNTQCTPLIEKWEQKGAGNPTGHFSPSKIEFSYIGDQEGEAEKDDDPREVQFVIESTTESYYQCINRPEEALLLRSTGNVDGGNVSIQNVYWESTGANKSKSSVLDVDTYEKHQDSDRELLRIEHDAGTKSFTITPIGNSPMGLKQLMYKEQQNGQTVGVEQWVDYDDDVVVEYTYGNGEVQIAKMRVVRKAYHEEEVPSMVFSINPATYTFATGAEGKEFDVVATHQHGTVIYNVDGQVIKENYTTKENISFNNNTLELVLRFDDENTWKKDEALQITATQNGDHKVKVSVEANGTGAKRSATLIGTLHPSQATGTHEPVPFTIQLHQRGKDAGGIRFIHKQGEGNDAFATNIYTDSLEQKVHTSERTIYYESGQSEIELRLPESGYSGYMRWYDYQTGGDPYYNYARGKASTSWVRSPRGFNDIVFSAINTPRNGDEATIQQEGYSHGLYSFNKANGGVLDEENPYNPMPIIRGWNYDYDNGDTDAAKGYHTIACDVSAYTDYLVVKENNQIKSITEPTLSYRQLFHLCPASEIADKLANLDNDEYLEEYHYIAPAGKQILLSTEYRHSKVRSHMSELCYFYRNGESLARVNGNVVWKRNGEPHTPTYTAELDYLIVRSEAPGQDTYTLEVDGTGQRIARFVVEFVDVEKYGPTNKTIITKQKIQNDYEIRSLIDFNSATEEQKATMDDGTVHVNQHLPWEQSTYGYVYPKGDLANDANFKRGAGQGVFPFYGEYSIVNEVKKDWAKGEQLGGKDKGFAMYIDGTMEPGLVASIEADANICEGQTMYCSAWLCNPTPAGWSGEGNPIFRCNVEGLNDGIWTNIETYFVGELLKGSGWQQVVFPIKSDKSYEKVRVSIYNFATTNQGNDFMVDDICLYVSQLPIAAYRGEMACSSNAEHETQGVAVLRIDYSKMDESSAGYIYYQIFNETYTETIEGNTIIGKAVTLGTNNTGYYHDIQDIDHKEHTHAYGSIAIPDAEYIPTENEIRPSVTKFIDELVESGEIHGKAYIKATNDSIEKYLLYVAHVIPNTKIIGERLIALYDKDDYSMRMANTPDELSVPACNMQTPLHTTQNTIFQLRNSDSADPLTLQSALGGDSIVGETTTNKFFSTSPMNCANNLYFLSMKVENSLALSGAGGIIKEITAPIYADWLVAEAWDDVYAEVRPTDEQKLADYNARLLAADEQFLEVYGFRRGEVTTAIMYDMRRVPVDSTENPNYYARSFEELNPNSFIERQNYEIVKSLYDKGLLQFYTPAVTFYLGAEDCVRYWAFPIEGSAKTTVQVGNEEVEYTIKDCNEARFVSVSSMPSDYHLNIAPILNDQKTALQKSMLPTIKMLEGSTSITFPINEIGTTTKIKGATINENQCTLSIIDNDAIAFWDKETGEIKEGNNKPILEIGKEYILRLTLLDGEWEYPGNTESNCRVGYIFINLQIVPQTLVWQPTGNSFNGWGKNENWKGWKDTNSNNQIDEGELVEGFVPMPEANVIIPKLDNALLYPYIVPEHEHSHYPMTVDFQPHHCNNIYFAPEAKIHNQHLLHYEKAFVDMQITAGKWNMMSAPLKKMVSGDMFIPHTGKYKEGGARIAEPDPFEVIGFQGLRHRDAAYLFYQHFYNQTVYSHYEDGGTTSAASIGFEESNSLSQPLQAGSGYSLYGVGMEGKETLTIRLPKPDTEYYYYTSTGVQSTNKTSVDRGENNDESYRLAFDAPHDADHEDQKMEIQLTNHTATDRFLFGNPTMAYIDMKLFLETNSAVLNPVFHRIEGSVWTAAADMSMLEDRYLAPMTSVLLETQNNEPRTAITVTLSADHLTLNNTVNTIAEEPENDTQRLIASSPNNPISELLTIYAFTPKGTARTVLATNPVANDYFVQGEDALFVSSGIENNTSVKSPLNMYTVAEQVPMMADVRQGISQIPLSILADTKVRTDYMQLAFYYTSNWTRTCYLVDSYTGQKIRIMNGLIISVEMPQNHERRYYIEGPDEYMGSSEGGVTTSTSTPSESINYKAWAYSPAAGNLVVSANDMFQRVRIYDMAGRLLADKTFDWLYNTATLTAPTGVCIVETVMRDGTAIYTQAIVK